MTVVRLNLQKLKANILSVLPASADRDRIVKGLGTAGLHKWQKLAQEHLKSTSRTYLEGLRQEEGDEVTRLVLEGKLANMVEQGWDGGDMREWMLESDRAKEGAKGKYLVVPFRHGTPDTTGRNVGPQMPTSIHKAAQSLKATVSRPGKAVGGGPGRTTVWGQRLHPDMPMQNQARKILQRKEKSWHATSKYMGMVRKAQPTRKGGSQTSGYHTFRTISENVDRGGGHWRHPGISARFLSRKVAAYLEELAPSIIAQALESKKDG